MKKRSLKRFQIKTYSAVKDNEGNVIESYSNEANEDVALIWPASSKLQVELKDGYLTVSAVSNKQTDEKNSEGKYLRRERYSGSCSRSFYVGEGVKQEDIKAKFEDGTLKLEIPKEEAKPAVEQKKYISIEG